MRKFYAFGLIGITLFFAACNDDTDHDGLVDTKDKCPFVAAKTKDGCPVPVKLGKVHLYLDNSASMGGYFKDSTAYKTVVSDLAVKVDKEVAPLDIAFIADKIIPYHKDAQQFTSDIATTRIANANSSELYEMIKQAVGRALKNDVTLFVSDGIMSFPDSAIRKDRNVNQTDADGVLKNHIYGTFVDLKKSGRGTSVYAFRSRFNGTYYDYQNGHVPLKGAIRPFYIWVIAQNDVLKLFDAKLAEISSFHPEQNIHFGLIDSAVGQYQIIPQLGRAGRWKAMPKAKAQGDQGIEEVEVSKTVPVQFSVGINLGSLPPYARDIRYLRQNIQLIASGCRASFVIADKKEVSAEKVTSNSQRASFENATHILEIRVTDMPLPNARVQLTMPLKYDTWYQDWSCMDDRAVQSLDHQTFAFYYLMEGLKQAYENKNKNYLNLTFNLRK